MANLYGTQSLRRVLKSSLGLSQTPRPRRLKCIHTTAICHTDGVYQELTAMRVKTPFIEALRKQKEEGIDPRNKSTPARPPNQDLAPKKMSDSHHRVVRSSSASFACLGLTDLDIGSASCTRSLASRQLSECQRTHQVRLTCLIRARAKECRLGTLFMDLDALSGIVAYKHTGESVTTVTAAVDRITINHPLKELCDLELSGQVTFATGRSSMEISLQVAKAPERGAEVLKEDVLMTCAFTMVSLDPTTKKPVPIAPLQVDSEEERRLFQLGENNYNAKKELAKTTLRKQTPNDEESDLIHAMWLKQLDFHGKLIHTDYLLSEAVSGPTWP